MPDIKPLTPKEREGARIKRAVDDERVRCARLVCVMCEQCVPLQRRGTRWFHVEGKVHTRCAAEAIWAGVRIDDFGRTP
jgi:hypothetical protein